jgi:hypothetical protein
VTRLERLIDEQIVRTLLEKVAVEMAREFLANETFRRTLQEMILRRSRTLVEVLLADEKETRKRKSDPYRSERTRPGAVTPEPSPHP